MRVGTDGRARSGASRRDRGFTVTEILVTVVLMGIVVAGILNAVMTGIKASAVSRNAARVETAIVNAADRINRAPNTECDYTKYARAAIQTEGWSPEQASVTQEYWRPNGEATLGGVWLPWVTPAEDPDAATCPEWAMPNPGTLGLPGQIVRRVTITIKSPDSRVTRTIQVVKSDV